MTDETTGAIVKRAEFGAVELEQKTEKAATALAAQAKAAVEARYIVALQRPRDWDEVRQGLLKECRRPRFAESARYAKPVGGGRVEGMSIRFAEAAMRIMTNMLPETIVVNDDPESRTVKVMLTDLESNITYSKDVVIQKTVERKRLKDNEIPIRKRINSSGQTVYLLPATEDDIVNKQNALESKVLRGHALRILPGDLKDECEEMIVNTLRGRATDDPDAERKRIADAFADLHVPATELKDYLGHGLDQCSPNEMVELRAVYQAIKDGEATWHEALKQKTGKTKKGDGNAKLKQRIADAQSKAKPAPKTAAAPVDTTGETVREPGEEG